EAWAARSERADGRRRLPRKAVFTSSWTKLSSLRSLRQLSFFSCCPSDRGDPVRVRFPRSKHRRHAHAMHGDADRSASRPEICRPSPFDAAWRGTLGSTPLFDPESGADARLSRSYAEEQS